MNVKTFEAPTLAEAMGLVRAELGDDAMIVATRSEANGVFRVIAATDEPPPVKLPTPKPEAASASKNPRIKPAPWITAGASAKSRNSGATRSAAPQARILQALEQHRATAALCDAFRRADEQHRNDTGAALAALFRFDPIGAAASRRNVVLAGPPGAGKTALAAKLAAHHVLAGGKARLIAADTLTTGGTDRLRALARVLGVQVDQADRPGALRDMLAAESEDRLTIVDTAAINCRYAADLSSLADLVASTPATPVLVLPAGMDAEDAAETARLFADLGCTHLAATRLDASWRLGGILSAAHAGGLALAEASTAPTIASGLIQLDTRTLLSRLMATGAAQTMTPA